MARTSSSYPGILISSPWIGVSSLDEKLKILVMSFIAQDCLLDSCNHSAVTNKVGTIRLMGVGIESTDVTVDDSCSWW